MKKILLLLFIFLKCSFYAQDILKDSLSFQEYLGYVKAHHPLVKQANLTLNLGEANLLKARGGFDPKIEVDFNRKKFKNTEYFNELNSTFKIPTWYGIEFKANFEENNGVFLNPNLTVPEDGLYSAGVSLSLAQGLLTNDRMATLRKAKFFREQTKADRDLLINEVLFEASKAYFNWLEAFNEEQIYNDFLSNALERLEAVKRSVEVGDKAAIDSLEARVVLQSRSLNYEAAKLKRLKAGLKASNFLWLNDIPIQFEDTTFPVVPSLITLNNSLLLDGFATDSLQLNNHPKLRSLNFKRKALSVDRNLKLNKLLPVLDVQYNFLSTEYNELNSFNTANYKAFVNFSIPLFLRKERGDLKLAKLKLKDIDFELDATSLTLKNKINAINTEITSLTKQQTIIKNVVRDNEVLLNAEERKFFLGESSLFLINSRERSLISSKLKLNKIGIERLLANTYLFNTLGRAPLEIVN